MIVYLALNKANGRIYIGQTARSLECRLREHCRSTANPFGKARRKYGRLGFAFAILDEAGSRAELNRKEQEWIAHYAALPTYNLTKGGDGLYGVLRPKEFGEAVRRRLVGRTFVDKFGPERAAVILQKMSAAKKGKTYEQLFGAKADRLRQNRSETMTRVRRARAMLGKTYEEIYGPVKGAELRAMRKAQGATLMANLGNALGQTGKSYAVMFGADKAEERRRKHSERMTAYHERRRAGLGK